MRTDQFSNDYHTAHISSVYYVHSYQSLAMPLKGRDTPADRPRNELEEEEEETVQTLQYSQDQVHHSGTAARPNGEVNDDCEFGLVEEDGDEDGSILMQFLQEQLFIYPRSVSQMSCKRREGVVRRSWRSRTSWGRRTTVVQRSLQSVVKDRVTQKSCRVTATRSIIKVTEQSACFGHGGVTAFPERRVTGVLKRTCLYLNRSLAFKEFTGTQALSGANFCQVE